MFEGFATNKAAAEDADATFDDTALALDVATGFPATMAPEDWVMDAAGIFELVPNETVALLPVIVPVPDESVLDGPEAERLVPSVPVADEGVTERPEAEELVPTVDPWVADADADSKVPVKEETSTLAEDAVAYRGLRAADADSDDEVPVKEEPASLAEDAVADREPRVPDADADNELPLREEIPALAEDTVADEAPTNDPAELEAALPLLDEI